MKEENVSSDIKNGRSNDEVNCLKVKADSQDVTPEERKHNVKKLAGAISHSLRANGEVNVRCFGSASIGKAAKALAIAKDYISKNYEEDSQKLQLSCAPGFITTQMSNGNEGETNELTGICFVTFATQVSNDDKQPDINQCKTTLMVKADSKDIVAEDRKDKVKKLAGAITHALEENKEVLIRCFGNATIGKAAKAIAIARGQAASKGSDIYCWPNFIVAEMGPEGNKQERTGISFYVYANC